MQHNRELVDHGNFESSTEKVREMSTVAQNLVDYSYEIKHAKIGNNMFVHVDVSWFALQFFFRKKLLKYTVCEAYFKPRCV